MAHGWGTVIIVQHEFLTIVLVIHSLEQTAIRNLGRKDSNKLLKGSRSGIFCHMPKTIYVRCR